VSRFHQARQFGRRNQSNVSVWPAAPDDYDFLIIDNLIQN
jgi:hypothetical protein